MKPIMSESFKIINKTPNFIKIYMFLSFFVITSLILLCTFFQYHKYENHFGYIGKEDDYYVALYLEDNAIWNLQKSVLSIDDINLEIKSKDISGDYYIIDNKNYRLVKLYGNIPNEYLTINEIVKVKIQKNKTTIFKEIRKGMNL